MFIYLVNKTVFYGMCLVNIFANNLGGYDGPSYKITVFA